MLTGFQETLNCKIMVLHLDVSEDIRFLPLRQKKVSSLSCRQNIDNIYSKGNEISKQFLERNIHFYFFFFFILPYRFHKNLDKIFPIIALELDSYFAALLDNLVRSVAE